MPAKIDQIERSLRANATRFAEWEMLWQSGFVDGMGCVRTAHILDVDYWARRGARYSRDLETGFVIFVKERFPDEAARDREVAAWSEKAPAAYGPLREIVFRLMVEGFSETDIRQMLLDYMLAYDGTRMNEEDLRKSVQEEQKALFHYFAASDRDELIAEARRRQLPLR